MSLEQILASVIFLVMFIIITIGKWHRAWVALGGAILMLVVVFLAVMRSPDEVVRVLNLGQLFLGKFWVPGHEHIESHGVNWQTIVFIFGMMIMVEGLAASGFFRWLCLSVAKLVHCNITAIFITFVLLAGFLSMFIDSITVMLFLSSVTIEIARLFKVDPVPFIISEISAANTGGSATMMGDPPNIIIGTSYGFGFIDFAVNTGPIAWAAMLVILAFFYLIYRKHLKLSPEQAAAAKSCPLPASAITSRRLFLLQTAVFIIVVLLLVTHQQSRLSVALIGIIAALLTVISAGSLGRAKHFFLKIDWLTLLFFFALFVTVGGLEVTGTLKALAQWIGNISGGNLFVVKSMILWISAFASAIVDNIPFAAAMVPVVAALAGQGMDLRTLSWALALGTDIGGNATPIGASANVVGTAIADREGYPISWGRYCKVAAPGMILAVGVCWLLLFVRYIH
jgi:Na+/H+ antiporter NhaD/arsenite permease-like protein